MNCELPDVQAGFRKGRGTRDQISNITGSSKKQESSRKTSISALLTMPKPLEFPGSSEDKASTCHAGDQGSIPGLGRSPGEGNGNPLQYSCLENPMDRGAWPATVHGVTKSQTRLSKFTSLLHFKALTVWMTINCGKFWKRWEYQTTWPVSWETCMHVRKQQLELDIEWQTGSR